ncbi:MAG: hypothetical protein IJY85_01740 [Ruminococcus sp.]|nr:hypothetical protein [Ruminococcus sp.]
MNLSDYRVREIRDTNGFMKLRTPTLIIDEGSYYRIASTYIYDKHKIKSMKLIEGKIVLHMDGGDIILTVQEKK